MISPPGSFANIEHLVGRPGFQFVIETITNEAVMDRLISECDIIYHLAAAVGVELIVQDPVRVIETNIKGCEAVLRIGARYRKKVYAGLHLRGVRQERGRALSRGCRLRARRHQPRRWSYACSKAMDEFLALAYARQLALPVVIMRFFNTVGPRQTGRYGMVVPRFVQQALRGEPLTVYGDGQQSRCFTDVADVMRAMVGPGRRAGGRGRDVQHRLQRRSDHRRAGAAHDCPGPQPLAHPLYSV